MIRRTLISAVFAAAAAGAWAQAPASAPVAGPTAEAGRKIYTSFCTRCHGVNLAVSSPAFFDLRTFPSGDKERFVRSVSKGVRAMPAWENIVKPEEIDAIWIYIGSVNGWGSDAAGSDSSGAKATGQTAVIGTNKVK